MEKTERLVPLSPEEFEKLKGGKTGSTGCFVIFVILTLIISPIIFFVVASMDAFLGRVAAFIVPVVALALIALAYFLQRSDKLKTERDLQAGQKRIVTAPVTNQFTRSSEGSQNSNYSVSMSYYVNIAGKEYKVSEEEYYKYKEGMIVEVHTAPNSNTFYGIYDASDGKLLTGELA